MSTSSIEVPPLSYFEARQELEKMDQELSRDHGVPDEVRLDFQARMVRLLNGAFRGASSSIKKGSSPLHQRLPFSVWRDTLNEAQTEFGVCLAFSDTDTK